MKDFFFNSCTTGRRSFLSSLSDQEDAVITYLEERGSVGLAKFLITQRTLFKKVKLKRITQTLIIKLNTLLG